MLGRSLTSDVRWDLLNENRTLLHKWYVPMNTLLHLHLVSSARIKKACTECCVSWVVTIHSLHKYFWSTTYTGLAWFSDTEKTRRHLLPRSSQAGRKNKNKTWKEGIAYTWQKNEDCPVRGVGPQRVEWLFWLGFTVSQMFTEDLLGQNGSKHGKSPMHKPNVVPALMSLQASKHINQE